jgi:pyruvate,water dikinase
VPEGTGNKAALLHRAARRGLHVPEAIVVPDETLGAAMAETDDPTALARRLALPALGERVAVRSAFSLEDRSDGSHAGRFASKLNVDPCDPRDVGDALLACWRSAEREAGPCRRDVLIMGMIPARHAGVAFTEPEHEDDLVNWCCGTAERLVGGAESGDSAELPRLRRWERPRGTPFGDLPPFAARLARLLRDLRVRFGAGPWDVEWADDGATCWLIQVREITRPVRRNELFTLANHREILPDPPSPLMTGVIAEASPRLYDYYRRLDPGLPATRPFIEVLHGRPLINLSLLLDTMRAWGLPTRLVTGSIGGGAERESGLKPSRSLRALPVLVRAGVDQLRAPGRADRLGPALVEEAERAGPGIPDQLEALRSIYTRFVQEMFGLTAAMSGPLSLARRLGVLEELGARSRTVTAELAEALSGLRRIAAEAPAVGASLARGRLPHAGRFRQSWDAFMTRFGHRGVYESDVARPRYREEPEALMVTLARGPCSSVRDTRRPRRSVRATLLAPLFAGAARATRAREGLRHETMRAFAVIRGRLRARAREHVARGGLPVEDDLFLLEPEEARALEAGASFGTPWIEARRGRQRARAEHPLPDVIRRFDPWPVEAGETGAWAASGVGLVRGVVEGHAWVMTTPGDPLPRAKARGPRILVAPAVDPGWVPLFELFDGVVIETGGDLSHASIVLREMGVVSITNVRSLLAHVTSGDWLAVDGGTGRVEILASAGPGARYHEQGRASRASVAPVSGTGLGGAQR